MARETLFASAPTGSFWELDHSYAWLTLVLVVFALAIMALAAGGIISSAGEPFVMVTICAYATGTASRGKGCRAAAHRRRPNIGRSTR